MSFGTVGVVPKLPILNQRSCGSCTACCTVFAIEEPTLMKAERVDCEHLCGAGCSVYETRPPTCRAYTCLWLRGLGDPVDDRPDRNGYVMHNLSANDNKGDIVVMTEVRAGALADGTEGQKVVDVIVDQGVRVMLMYADGRKHARLPLQRISQAEYEAWNAEQAAMAAKRDPA
jgi:hypothetical protein